MRKETAEMIVLLVCCWGCAALFWGIGRYALCRKEPMWFWAGSVVDPKTVTDIPAYNRANAIMWKLYSVPFWVAGGLAFFGKAGAVASAILIALACFPGLFILIRQYRRMEQRYIQKSDLS